MSCYSNLGWQIVPLYGVHGGKCTCGDPCRATPGKHPRLDAWTDRATTDLDQVRTWLQAWPICNWGIRCGPESGIWMVGPDGDEGAEAMASLIQQYGDLPPGPWQWSGTAPGYHLIFGWPAYGNITNQRNHRSTKIDVRGANGQFVVAPSRSLTGAYRWEVTPWEMTVPQAPDWLIAWVASEKTPPAAPRPHRPYRQAGNRPHLRDRARKYLETVDPAISGQGGHGKTFWAARVLVWGFDLHPDDAMGILISDYNPRCVPEWSERELRHKVLQAEVVPYGKARGWLAAEDRPRPSRVLAAACTNRVAVAFAPSPPAADPSADAQDDAVHVYEAIDDPHRLAGTFLRAASGMRECPTPRYWRDEWYVWRETHYERLKVGEIRSGLVATIKREFDRDYIRRVRHAIKKAEEGGADPEAAARAEPPAKKVTCQLASNVLQALASLAHLPADTQDPSWIVGDRNWQPEDILAARNAIVHLPTGEAIPPTPALWSTRILGTTYDPTAGPPKAWLEFLGKLWPNEPDAIRTLQEWMGYCLSSNTNQQKMLLLIGPARSGKSTIARIMRAIIGEAVASPTLSNLAGPFGLQPLLGKTLAIITEARLSGRTDSAQVVERLLSISGEDGQTVERKHLPSVDVPKLSTRFMMVSNELPRLTEASGALVARMVILRVTKSWLNQEDQTLAPRLLAELPAILLWAIEGWHRLQQRGRFVQPASSAALVEQMDELASPIRAFLRETCTCEPTARVPVQELYNRWRQWCVANGREPTSQPVFGRDLRAAMPTIEVTQIGTRSQRVRFYAGLRLLDDPAGHVFAGGVFTPASSCVHPVHHPVHGPGHPVHGPGGPSPAPNDVGAVHRQDGSVHRMYTGCTQDGVSDNAEHNSQSENDLRDHDQSVHRIHRILPTYPNSGETEAGKEARQEHGTTSGEYPVYPVHGAGASPQNLLELLASRIPRDHPRRAALLSVLSQYQDTPNITAEDVIALARRWGLSDQTF